jgi:flavorubredoxin
MKTTVDEIAPDIFRIATLEEGSPVTMVQFLIRDEEPLLYHTGHKDIFEPTYDAIAGLIDPAKLRYISWSHLEADECGSLNQFLAKSPHAEPVHGEVSGMLGQSDFFDKPIRVMPDGDSLSLGSKSVRFITTPHVPHCWDAICAFEETTGTLFVSDLFTAFGESPARTDGDIVGPALATIQALPDYMPVGPHTERIFDRLIALKPRRLAGHHSSTYDGDATQALVDMKGELMKMARG